MARKTKEEAAQTREAIMESALDLFNEKGYSGTTLNDVARKLGLTKGAVYWHFKNKNDLFKSLIEELEIRFNKKLIPTALKTENLEDLENFFIEYATLSLNDSKINKFITVISLKIEWTEEFKEILNHMETLSNEVTDFCKTIIKSEQLKGRVNNTLDPALTAIALTSMVDGVLFEPMNPDITLPQRMEILKTSLKIFFKGMI